jgi:hypothetical protein
VTCRPALETVSSADLPSIPARQPLPRRFTATSVRSLVLVWCATSVTALAVAPTDRRLAIAVVFAGSMAILMVSGLTVIARLVTVVALVPAAVADPVSLLWVGAAALMAFVGVVGAGRARERSSQLSEPRRHLMRSRRRNEPAAIFVAELSTGRTQGRQARAIAGSSRLTDSVEVARSSRGFTIRGVIDAGNLDRDVVEERVCAAFPEVRFGWAHFPDEGVTFDYLVEQAQAALARSRATVTDEGARSVADELALRPPLAHGSEPYEVAHAR